jgi:hypothetical protein
LASGAGTVRISCTKRQRLLRPRYRDGLAMTSFLAMTDSPDDKRNAD